MSSKWRRTIASLALASGLILVGYNLWAMKTLRRHSSEVFYEYKPLTNYAMYHPVRVYGAAARADIANQGTTANPTVTAAKLGSLIEKLIGVGCVLVFAAPCLLVFLRQDEQKARGKTAS